MTRPDDIPQDVWAAADTAFADETLRAHMTGDGIDPQLCIARAILADRARRASPVPVAPVGVNVPDSEPAPGSWDMPDAQRADYQLAARTNTDGAAPPHVLAALIGCAVSWVPEARIIGNIRALDIVRALVPTPATGGVTEAMVESACASYARWWRDHGVTEAQRDIVRHWMRRVLEVAFAQAALPARDALEEAAKPHDAVLRNAGTMWQNPLRLNGDIFDDRKKRFADGTNVTTSAVQSIEGDIVHTRNTIYRVEWIDDSARAAAIRSLGERGKL